MYHHKIKSVIEEKIVAGEWCGATDVDGTPVITIDGRILPVKPVAAYFGINITDPEKRSKGKTHEDMDQLYTGRDH